MDRDEALKTLRHNSTVLEAKMEDVRQMVLRFAGDIAREASEEGTALQKARQLVRTIETRQQMLAPELQGLRDLIVEVAMDSGRVAAITDGAE